MIAITLAAVLMAAAPAAGAQTVQAPTSQPAPAAKSAKPDKDELVCRKEAIVGSRMKTRVCLPRAEWNARQAQSKDELDAAQRNQPCAGPNC